MENKIAISSVVRDALSLLEERKKLYSILTLSMYVFGLPLLTFSGNPEDMLTPEYGVLWLVLMLMGMALYVVLFNASITTLRGDYKLLPQSFGKKYFITVGKVFLLGVMVLVPGMVLMIPATVLGVVLGAIAEGTLLQAPIMVLTGTLATLALVYLGFRWGLAIPAIAVGDESSYKLSWRMTRGNSFRMIACALPFGVGNAAMQLVVAPDPQTGVINFLTPAVLAMTLVSCVAFWITFLTFIVWYEKLKNRYESMSETEIAAE